VRPALLTLGAVAALAAASTASRRGSPARRAVTRGENLEQRIKRVLEEEPPEVALRVVFLMASLPRAVVNGYRMETIQPGSSYQSVSTYLEAGILDTLRRDVSIVQAREAGRPNPRDEPDRWVSLPEVADYLWAWVDEGRWMGVDSHWSRSRDLVPVVDWVAQEVSRFVSERPPVRLLFGAISSSRATNGVANRLVTLDEDRMGRLLDYMLDVVASDDPRGLRSGVDYLAEKRRWEAFGMEEVLGSDVRHFDKEYGITHLRGLGGRSLEVNAIHQPLSHPRTHWSLWRRAGWGGGLVNLLWGIQRERGVPEGRMERRAKVGYTHESLLIHAHMMMLWRTLSKLLEPDWQVAASDDLYGVPWAEAPEYEVVKKVRATRARSEPGQEWSGLRTRRRDWVPTP
jgi:hypothetical protein